MSAERWAKRPLRRQVSPCRVRRICLMATLVFATALPVQVLAQTGVIVDGRVYDAGSDASVHNAIVELEGHGATMTSTEGAFRFEGVEPGGYTLGVVAFGYTPESRFIAVTGATTVPVPLEIAPLPVDPLLVELRRVDIEGRVRDPERDLSLVDAEILTNQVPGTQTDSHGSFKLEDVFEAVPLRMIVRAFGYLPVDTILLPDEDERYLFELEPDSLVERMIEVQVGRLEERAAGRRAVIMRPMNRERLLLYAGSYTLRDVLETEYRSYVGRIRCAFVDEEQIYDFGEFLTVLGTTLPEEVERIEFLFRGVMLRVYTREFIRDMVARDVELRTPFYNRIPRPPVCR